jgi:HK97 family phage portal protein
VRTTDSGLIVPDFRSDRALPPPGSADHGALIEPNANEPVGTVGPQAMQGEVMSAPPPMVMPWDGWPAGWDTPLWGEAAGRSLTSADIVFACIDLNARVTADMPVSVRTAGLPAEPRAWLVNPQPEIYASWQDFWQQLWWDFQSAGESIIYATSRFADGFPRTFLALEPWMCLVELDSRSGLRRFYSPSGEDITDDVLHIRYLTQQNVARGIGPLEAAGEKVRAARALSRYGADLAQNGGIPWAVLTHKFRLTPKQITDLRTQWIDGARSRMGAPAILDSDMGLQQLQVTPRDMALRELQQFAESRIAVLLGVPPFLVGLPAGGDSLTYSSSVSLFDYHWRAMLRPKAREITAALSGWALPRGTELRIDPSSYTQESMAVVGQFLEAMQRMGAMTVQEIREFVGLPPLPAVGVLPAQQEAVA